MPPGTTEPPAGSRTFDDFVAACAGANLAQTESMARQFVAEHPGEERGWLVLVGCVEQGGNFPEAERLAAMGLERFARNARLRAARARALVQCGRLDEACGLLDGSELSPEDALLRAEIELARDPPRAARTYAALAEAFPRHPAVALGRLAAESAGGAPERPPAIAFLVKADWHAWIHLPIAQALRAGGTAFTCTTNAWMLPALRPQVVVLSSPTPPVMGELRQRLPRARFVNTRHGVSVNGKNYGLYSAGACEFVCASSEHQAGELRRLALLPAERVWPTGYPQMDALFRRLRGGPAGASPGRRVLFAPTFNPELSAAYLVGEDPVPALRGDDESIRVVLTGHPQLRQEAPALLAAWRSLARTRPNVEYFDSAEENVVALLPEADVLVSDVSSVATQYLALDRPLVRLVDLERARASRAYDPGATEWQLDAAATTVTRREDLAAAVRAALAGSEPEAHAANRRRLREELFGTLTDGRAGERIAQRLANLVSPSAT